MTIFVVNELLNEFLAEVFRPGVGRLKIGSMSDHNPNSKTHPNTYKSHVLQHQLNVCHFMLSATRLFVKLN